MSGSEKEKVSHIQCIDNPNEPIEYTYGIEGNVPSPMFAPILVPVEESLLSHLLSQSQHSDFVHILQCKEEVLKTRAEHNDPLLMAKHYRNMAENSKRELQCLEQKNHHK